MADGVLKLWDGSQWVYINTGQPGSKWYSGAGSPASGLGVETDWYLDEANGDIYEKINPTAWALRTNITGPSPALYQQPLAPVAAADGSFWNDTDDIKSYIRASASWVSLSGATGATGASGLGGLTWSMGPAVEASNGGYKWKARRTCTVLSVSASLGTAPSGGDGFTVNARKNGVTILSPLIVFTAGNLTVDGVLSGTPTLVDGDCLDVAVSSVTGTSMERLTVQVELV
jgi:hypothetical protein